MVWAPDYTTTEDLAEYMRIADSVDDAVLAQAITTASRSIDQTTSRQFGTTTTAQDRYYTARYESRRAPGVAQTAMLAPYQAFAPAGRWVIDIDDVQDITGLTITYDVAGNESYAGAVDGYRLLEVNAAAEGRPYTKIRVLPTSTAQPGALEDGVKVHAIYGWTAVPAAVKQACELQASRLVMRRDSPFGIAGSADAGSELRLMAKVDPDVEVALRPYRRWWGAV